MYYYITVNKSWVIHDRLSTNKGMVGQRVELNLELSRAATLLAQVPVGCLRPASKSTIGMLFDVLLYTDIPGQT